MLLTMEAVTAGLGTWNDRQPYSHCLIELCNHFAGFIRSSQPEERSGRCQCACATACAGGTCAMHARALADNLCRGVS